MTTEKTTNLNRLATYSRALLMRTDKPYLQATPSESGQHNAKGSDKGTLDHLLKLAEINAVRNGRK